MNVAGGYGVLTNPRLPHQLRLICVLGNVLAECNCGWRSGQTFTDIAEVKLTYSEHLKQAGYNPTQAVVTEDESGSDLGDV